MIKIGEISPKGIAALRIYYDDKAKRNPYKVFAVWAEAGSYGVTKRRKKVAEYANLSSCAECLWRYTVSHDEERR